MVKQQQMGLFPNTNEGLFPVRLDRMLESLRNAEYEFTSGIGEIVDNSIEARAQNIYVSAKTAFEDRHRNRKTEVLSEIAIIDDGYGMNITRLQKSLVLGEGDRPINAGGKPIGKFGVGLTLGSISLARRLEVYSRTKPQEPFMFVHLDLDDIKDGIQQVISTPVEQSLPQEYAAILKDSSGTVVLLKNCDRLQYDPTKDRSIKASDQLTGLAHFLGRTYRKFIGSGVNIWVNGESVFLHDPLYAAGPTKFDAQSPEHPDLKAKIYGNPVSIPLPIPGKPEQTAEVTITMSLLPHMWRSEKGMGGNSFSKEHKITENEGISILRADREVLFGPVPYIIGTYGQAKFQDIDRWWGCEIAFPPELDSYFQVRYIKRGAEPIASLRDKIREKISPVVAALRKQIQTEFNKPPEQQQREEDIFRDASEIMAEADQTIPQGKRGMDISQEQAEKVIDEVVDQAMRVMPPFTTSPITTEPSLLTDEKLQAQKEELKVIREQKKREIREQPYSIVPVRLGEQVFFEPIHQLGKVILKLNVDHPFYKVFFEPLCGSVEMLTEDSDADDGARSEEQRRARRAIMLLLLSFARAETFFRNGNEEIPAKMIDDEEKQRRLAVEVIDNLRAQWGITLKTASLRAAEKE